jgi:glutamate racemase
VDVVPLKNLATLAEEIFYKGESPSLIKQVDEQLNSIKGLYHHVILGCTHYLHIEKIIADIIKAKCISPAEPIARRVKEKVATESTVFPCAFNFLSTSINRWEKRDLVK